MHEGFRESHKIETYKSMITLSVEVFRALILLNGAAAAGIVAAMDKLSRLLAPHTLRHSLTAFLLGLIFAMLATLGGWFTQNTLHNENIAAIARGKHLRWVQAVVLLCVASIVAFSAGGLIAVFGIQQ
ncbi:hypothetical protein [Candidimonas nitroreducens]|uniref:DUF202 domain-containing protein n=1 Tax=Candidimonas nitroreducens TaxID=683354 RepID=A0A225MKG9_9BURK|nr:hypothetical protein [Candidimonas nitroreducens]OWT61877.1 hypothetical protein CEY11_08575 [Candidimonas nitroreducens]